MLFPLILSTAVIPSLWILDCNSKSEKEKESEWEIERIKHWYILHVSFNSVCSFIRGLCPTAHHSSETAAATSSLLIGAATQIASEAISIYLLYVYIHHRFSLNALCKTISYFNFQLSPLLFFFVWGGGVLLNWILSSFVSFS